MGEAGSVHRSILASVLAKCYSRGSRGRQQSAGAQRQRRPALEPMVVGGAALAVDIELGVSSAIGGSSLVAA
jgi:hypothetical protein